MSNAIRIEAVNGGYIVCNEYDGKKYVFVDWEEVIGFVSLEIRASKGAKP